MVAFIDANKDDVVEGRPLGVEPICTLLQVAPSTYYAAKDRAPSARAVSDSVLTPELVTLWKAARRAGLDIGRNQTCWLMRAAGIEGAIRTKRVKTTRPDPASARHPDLVRRECTATAPHRLWVTDLTFVPTWASVATSASSSTRTRG
ncbi:transposase InsO family protein [Microbacterium halimionae]|uniref:Transposase InsO family protein n=1 Tax=Microbacterium halimionae TaxID=1526413 RepID=A0A7W3JNM0_9MICO|nr:transposase InsO family protein [Microbacterium halimionae]NII96369.1 transposase InsO family protein [Microbacterium halimionae]